MRAASTVLAVVALGQVSPDAATYVEAIPITVPTCPVIVIENVPVKLLRPIPINVGDVSFDYKGRRYDARSVSARVTHVTIPVQVSR